MRISEFEYHVISELITMEDRELAQKIELDIFRHGPSPNNERLRLYVDAMKDSGTPEEWLEAATKLLETSGLEFVPRDAVTQDEQEQMGGQKLNIKTTRTPIKDHDEYKKRLMEGEAYEAC